MGPVIEAGMLILILGRLRACTGRCDRIPRGAGGRIPGPGQLCGKKHNKIKHPTSEIVDLWCYSTDHATYWLDVKSATG